MSSLHLGDNQTKTPSEDNVINLTEASTRLKKNKSVEHFKERVLHVSASVDFPELLKGDISIPGGKPKYLTAPEAIEAITAFLKNPETLSMQELLHVYVAATVAADEESPVTEPEVQSDLAIMRLALALKAGNNEDPAKALEVLDSAWGENAEYEWLHPRNLDNPAKSLFARLKQGENIIPFARPHKRNVH